jgi:hypothetical protein
MSSALLQYIQKVKQERNRCFTIERVMVDPQVPPENEGRGSDLAALARRIMNPTGVKPP